MVNHFIYNTSTDLYSVKNLINFYRCLSTDKTGEILLLHDPKFVYLISENNSTKYNHTISINQSFSSIDNNRVSSTIINKYDKKNKSYLKQVDHIDTKKNKIKFKKQNRNKVNLDKEDLFIANNRENVLTNDSLDVNLIRQPKFNKSRRKNRVKQTSSKVTEINNNCLEKDFTSTKEIVINTPLTIQELSTKLKIPEAEIITMLFLKGISVTINQVVDISIATEIAMHYSFSVQDSDSTKRSKIEEEHNIDESTNNTPRSAVITLFGHIDHGKTTLLDTIRKTNIVKNEAGGITQSIAGYEVDWVLNSERVRLVFLDTPGHEAFISMRLRGAKVTDIAMLVVAANDGLQPQTIESIEHIKNNNLPCIIAINKIDKENINTLKVKEELAEYNLVAEDWGGNIPIVEVSALMGQNIDILLSKVCMLSKAQALKANPNKLAEGTILEAYLDKARGPVANILVQNGTLNVGDIIISQLTYGKIKAIVNHQGMKTTYAQPSSIVQVWGFSDVPQAGSGFNILNNEKQAKQQISKNLRSKNQNNILKSLNTRISFDVYKNSSFHVKQLNLILKADTEGSIEAIVHSLTKIPQNKVQLNILSASSGNISSTDIDLAVTSNSIFIVFNVNISLSSYNLAKKSGIMLYNFKIIYDLLDFINKYMLDLVDPEYDNVFIGLAIVQTVFDVNKGSVAGCIVNNGKLQKDSSISVYRDDKVVYNGILNSLKRIKNDVNEVTEGHECGVMSYNYDLWQKGDIIKAYQLIEKKKVL